MELHSGSPYYYYYWLCFCLVLITHVFLLVVTNNRRRGMNPGRPRLPPGPWQLPVIGSLHYLVCRLPHRAMCELSRRHGPLMQLRICEHDVVVVSSAEAAREMFKGDRPDETAALGLEQRPSSPSIDEVYSGEGALGVIFAPYDEHWQQLRRILATELLGSRRVNAFSHVRRDEAARLVATLKAVPPGQPVNVDELLVGFIADSSMRAIFGDRLPDRAAFLEMMRHGTDLSLLFDLRDLFPSSWLVRMLPPRGPGKVRYRREVSRVIDEILRKNEERRAAGHGGVDGEKYMMDVLLGLQKEGSMRLSLTPGVINSVAMEIFGAAVNTSSTTLQWAMAELIANPRVMENAQLEVRRVLAGHETVQQDDDDAALIREMRYLKAVIKETLRLHPPAPFIPRVCLDDDRKVQGYDVPRGTIVVINAWAIARDPEHWEDPESFVPERFEREGAPDFRGPDFMFTPFGVGRRMCPGMTFSHAHIETALASLLFHFDWELPPGVRSEDLDMTESFGLTLKRKDDLLLYPIPRTCDPTYSTRLRG